MQSRLRQALVAAGLTVLASSPALAGKEHGHTKDMKKGYWEYLDADGDGQVTREEFIQHAERHFSKMDRNSDSVVTSEEFEEMRKKHKEKMHKHKKKMRMQDQEP